MPKVCGIYIVRNTVNDKVYVGQSVNIEHRWKSHIKESRLSRSNSHFYGAIRKYGIEAFSIEALEVLQDATQCFLDERETFWIAHFDACNYDKGYNFRPGGQAGQVVDAETRERISLKLKGRKLSPERIEQMRISATGRRCTQGAKEKLSEFHKGIVGDEGIAEKIKEQIETEYADKKQKPKRILRTESYKTNEFRSRVSKRFKGTVRSEEVRKNMSDAAKNRNHIAEQHRLEALRAVTKARWDKWRAEKLAQGGSVCS